VAPPKNLKLTNIPSSNFQINGGPHVRKAQDNTLGASGGGDVEALNRILNNINVHTKKNEGTDGKLPRKILYPLIMFSHQKGLT
jgi:hypothetical protein